MVVLNTIKNTVYAAINKHSSIPNSSNPALSKAVFEEDLCGMKAPCSLPREAALSHAALSFAGYAINSFGLGVNTFYKDYYQSKLPLA